MSDYLQRDSNTITIANFFEAHQLKKYNFDPEYQRKSIWSEEKKSFLINSIVRNFPIPPIFLHQKIDDSSGMTRYDVIDGKQRLTAIIEFLENKLPISDESSEDSLSGLYFKDLDSPQYADYKKRFWRYSLSIEYIDTSDKEVIDSIFDRLNRNGEPLTGQELRNSNYYNSALLQKVEVASKHVFWEDRLEVVDKARMEDLEFVSELFFLIAEGDELGANQDKLDQMYAKYAEKSDDEIDAIYSEFISVTELLADLNLDYDGFKIGGVSHLYGLFSFCRHCLKNGITPYDKLAKIVEFYTRLREQDFDDVDISSYKQSMSSRTKESSSRKKRKNALVSFCNI